jgi:hypothetical protein
LLITAGIAKTDDPIAAVLRKFLLLKVIFEPSHGLTGPFCDWQGTAIGRHGTVGKADAIVSEQ